MSVCVCAMSSSRCISSSLADLWQGERHFQLFCLSLLSLSASPSLPLFIHLYLVPPSSSHTSPLSRFSQLSLSFSRPHQQMGRSYCFTQRTQPILSALTAVMSVFIYLCVCVCLLETERNLPTSSAQTWDWSVCRSSTARGLKPQLCIWDTSSLPENPAALCTVWKRKWNTQRLERLLILVSLSEY